MQVGNCTAYFTIECRLHVFSAQLYACSTLNTYENAVPSRVEHERPNSPQDGKNRLELGRSESVPTLSLQSCIFTASSRENRARVVVVLRVALDGERNQCQLSSHRNGPELQRQLAEDWSTSSMASGARRLTSGGHRDVKRVRRGWPKSLSRRGSKLRARGVEKI